MPSWKDALSEKERWQLVNYIRKLNKDANTQVTEIYSAAAVPALSDRLPRFFSLFVRCFALFTSYFTAARACATSFMSGALG